MTAPLLNLSDTWNASGTVFDAIRMNVQNTASAAGSRLLNLQSGGTSQAIVDINGRLVFGNATALSNTFGGGNTPQVQILGTSLATAALSGYRFSNDISPAIWFLGKSRGAAVGTQTIVANGDFLGRINFEGSDGTNFQHSGRIDHLVDGAPSAGNVPGAFIFLTTPVGGGTTAGERMRIKAAGDIVWSVNAGATNGQSLQLSCVTELTTIAAAATTATVIQIPAPALVFAVSTRVVTVIPTAATFTVTGTTSNTTFASSVGTAAGTTDPGTSSSPLPFVNTAAQTITFTPNVTPAAATGQIRVTAYYFLVNVPTS